MLESMIVRLVIMFIVFVIVCFGIYVIYLTHNNIRKFFVIKWFQISMAWKAFTLRMFLLHRFNKVLKASYSVHAIDIVFEMFIHFYEMHFADSASWHLPEEFFPRGVGELTAVYKWIQKDRKDNFNELNKIIPVGNKIEYWNTEYNTFTFTIDRYGVVHIFPILDETKKNGAKRRLALENALYNLDSAKCAWIIERRRFFHI